MSDFEKSQLEQVQNCIWSKCMTSLLTKLLPSSQQLLPELLKNIKKGVDFAKN